MYNITCREFSTGICPSFLQGPSCDFTRAEFTIFGTNGSITWVKQLYFDDAAALQFQNWYWPRDPNIMWTIKVDRDFPQRSIGAITGVQIRYGPLLALHPRTPPVPGDWRELASSHTINSFIVTTNICEGGECKATVFTTAPSASKTFSTLDTSATYFKLYPLNEFATSRAFTSNFVL
jgi:hypothetical protein